MASGSPDTLGGRDHGETTVRFRLPAGVGVADLPLPDGAACERRGEFVELHMAEPTETLHRLTGWAIERGEVLDGLAVVRPTLEDVYLSLTGGDVGHGGERRQPEADTVSGARRRHVTESSRGGLG